MLKKSKIIGAFCTSLLFLGFAHTALAAEYIPFRERHPRLIIPQYEEAKVLLKEDGPQLIFSDSPEMVQDCGITYRDTIKGKVRLFFHHVNDTKSDKKLAVVIRNRSIRAAEITLGAFGVSQPRNEEEWLLAGKEAQRDYFHTINRQEKLKVLKYKELLTGATGRRFKPNELITGIIDLETNKPVEIAFLMLPVRTDFALALDMYKPLPADKGNHVLRGTFPSSNVHVTVPEAFNTEGNKIVGITLADNVKNPYVRGIDALTGKPVINYGNYGVFYDVHFKTTGKGQALVNFSPEGGTYAGYGKFGPEGKSKVIPIPAKSVAFGHNGAEDAITLGKLEGNQQGEVVFSPPGSSNLPIKIILIPEKRLEKKQ